jgi:hypothetical protein
VLGGAQLGVTISWSAQEVKAFHVTVSLTCDLSGDTPRYQSKRLLEALQCRSLLSPLNHWFPSTSPKLLFLRVSLEYLLCDRTRFGTV